jgi:hypothetical protein
MKNEEEKKNKQVSSLPKVQVMETNKTPKTFDEM